MLNLTQSDYVNAIEKGTTYFFRLFASMKNLYFYENNDIRWVKSDNKRFPNIIFNAKFSKGAVEQRIEELADGIKKGKLPNAWHLGPNSTPENLFDLLIDHGFKEIDDEGPGMALSLSDFEIESKIPEELKIKQVDNYDDYVAWINIANNELMGRGALENCIYSKMINEPSLKLYLAFWNNKPAATSMYALDGNVADIDIIATVPEYRNRGIGTAIAAAPLLDLKKLGAEIAILRASEMGRKIYKKIGFKEYCTYRVLGI